MPFDITATERNVSRLKDADEVINQIVSEFSESENVLNPWKSDIVSYYELYSLVQKHRNYEGLATIFVPEILRAVETVVAKLYQMIFGQPDWMEYSGRDNNGDDGPALALTELAMFQCEENHFKARNMDALRQMVITGLTVRKIGWDYQEVPRIKGVDVKTGKTQKQIETVRDTWTFEPVDLLTFHISDITTPYNDLQKAQWIGEEYLATKQWVRERTKRGWLSDVMKDKYGDDVKAPTGQAQVYIDQRFGSSSFVAQDKGKDSFHVIERWGLCKAAWVMTDEELAEDGYEADDMVEAVIIILNKKGIAKLERNPWYHQQKPYVACPYIAKEFELPGMGAAKIGKSLQEEINDTRNQTLDNKTLVLCTMWLKSAGSGIKDKDLIIRQNGVVRTNDMNGLQPLRPPVVAGIGTNMEGIAKDDLRESVGAASNLQGIAQAGVGTATESNTINRESLGRLLLVAQTYAELILKPTFIMAEYLNYQFYDHVKVIRIIGPSGAKYKQLRPEEIAGGNKDVSIRISVDATENPAIQRQQLLNFYTLVQSTPPQMIPLYWNLLDKIYGMFFRGHKLDEVLPNPGNIRPEDQLTPEEERDCVLAEQPVSAKSGQDHAKYVDYLTKEFNEMKFSLNEKQFELFKALIMSHYQMLQQEVQQQHEQMVMQQIQQNQEQGAKGQNKGQGQNVSQHTQTNAPTTGGQAQNVGG